MSKVIMVTGAAGMIGSRLVESLIENGKQVVGIDRRAPEYQSDGYIHRIIDLSDATTVKRIFESYEIDRVIHLAALAHTVGVKDTSYQAYYNANVKCAENVFLCAESMHIPVLFISTVDVYGLVKGMATAETEPHPISNYGKTKYLAEQRLKEYCSNYDIFRFAPVYAKDIKRDVQKRYYLKYPDWAYKIGNGMSYELLNIDTAVRYMADWCEKAPTAKVFNIKNEALINTADCIAEERAQGRAKHVFYFPLWVVELGFGVLYCLTGKNKYTFLLNKAVHPLRTE